MGGRRLTISTAAGGLLFAVGVLGVVSSVAALRNGDSGPASPSSPALSDTATADEGTLAAVSTQGSTPAGTTPPDASNEGAIEPPVVEAPAGEVVAAAAAGGGRFTMPLAAWTAVTDRYGAARGGGLIHGGIDLALDDHHGSTVYSACAGTVASTATNATYGNHVIVDCGEGWSTLYGHLSAFRTTAGTAVAPGATLGVSGSTGFSTGEHLHFEIRWKGTPVNPESYLDFHIAPGTPLSNGPITIERPTSGATGTSGATEAPATETPTAEATAESTATATATATATPAPPTATPTATPIPPTATPTATPTRRPPPPTPTPLPPVR